MRYHPISLRDTCWLPLNSLNHLFSYFYKATAGRHKSLGVSYSLILKQSLRPRNEHISNSTLVAKHATVADIVFQFWMGGNWTDMVGGDVVGGAAQTAFIITSFEYLLLPVLVTPTSVPILAHLSCLLPFAVRIHRHTCNTYSSRPCISPRRLSAARSPRILSICFLYSLFYSTLLLPISPFIPATWERVSMLYLVQSIFNFPKCSSTN